VTAELPQGYNLSFSFSADTGQNFSEKNGENFDRPEHALATTLMENRAEMNGMSLKPWNQLQN